MSIIEIIKERLHIEDIISRYVPLTKTGKNLRALCPFHNEQTPSFFVFPDSQRYKCFGCGASGDLFDFVMQREGWDMDTALRELAAQAGVVLSPQSAEEKRRLLLQREKETVFAVAVEHFHQALGLARGESPESGSPGLDYARRRGFTDETLRAAGVGFFGKAWSGLRDALRTAGVDLECPAAVALVGYRGDVRAWGEKYNIEPAAQWIEAGKIKALPPNLLIYPHIQHGRVVYFSGRYIAPAEDGPKSWNPPSALVGERAPYGNWLWGRAKPESGGSTFPYSVIVEGQACALTLGQWGIPALAMAGCDLGERPDAQHPVLMQVQRQLAITESRAVLGLDQDAAGAAGTPKLVAALLNLLGLKATAFHAVAWPQVDVNAWLQAGGTAAEARTLLAQAPPWIDVLLENARPVEGAMEGNKHAAQTLFTALAELDVYDVARMREKISRALQIKRGVFDTLLKAARQGAGLDDDGKPKYVTLGGRLCHRFYDGHGNEIFTPLCNFTAQILAEIVEDDGEEQTRLFRIGGHLADGTRLAQVDVAAGDFSGMNWILLRWGARAVVEAGAAARDHLRAAIQATSRDVQLQHVYRHLGWREIDAQQVYLSGNGAVGRDAVEVALPTDLARYRLPQQPEHIEDALRASLRFLDVGEHLVTVPLLAAMYFAPLCELAPPTFTLWVYGTTGSLKSTLTALALCHYGKFAYNTPHASWTGTTNALEKKAFLVKDAPLWIDDYTPQSTVQGMNELKGKVDQLLRDWGNRSGRARMRADLQLRQTFAPRGLIIGTAEQLPPGQSIQARLFQVEVHPEMVTRGADSPLTKAQIEDAPLYPHAMAGYVQWLAKQWETLTEALPERLLNYTEAAREKGAHLRMPNNVATLFLGWELFLDYCLHCTVVTDTEYADLRDLGWTVLIALGEAQQDVAQEEKPVEMYLSALRQLLQQGTLYLRSRAYPDLVEQEYPKLSARATNAEFVGWYDDQYIYLLSKVAYRVVHKFYRDSGVVFPDTEHGVKVKLKEQGLLFPAESGREPFFYQLPIEGRPRVLRISNFLSVDKEPSS